ncbi:MAG: inorganic phosphate transporter [Bacteroidales bacterium]
MLFFILLSSGLFLGWSLGANDASNVFGTAVGSRMISFRRAAWIASVFVVLGAVFQGHGTTDTLNKLGEVDKLAGGFTVAFCAALSVLAMTRFGLPVSTSQAVVGGIIGWALFAGRGTDLKVLSKIVGTWVSGPILGIIFGILLFLSLRYFLRRARIHVIKLDSILRYGLIIVGAFGAYSLGANNIANVMGMFVSSAPNIKLNFGIFSLNEAQVLFLIGGLAISLGIFTYSKHVMQTVGRKILALTPEAAFVVVLSQALVLFIFSSSTLSNFIVSLGLPPIPLVPVSSTQVVVGAVMGIGLIKGGREIRFRTLVGIAIGWITTPLFAGILTYFALFFVKNIFNLQITSIPDNTNTQLPEINSNRLVNIDLAIPFFIITSLAALSLIVFMIFYYQNKRLKNKYNELFEQYQETISEKDILKLDVNSAKVQSSILNKKLITKQEELNKAQKQIENQHRIIEKTADGISNLLNETNKNKRTEIIKRLLTVMKERDRL